MERQSFENEYVSFELREGILFGRYKVKKLDFAVVKSATAFRKKMMQGREIPAIADISIVKQVDKEARQFLSSPEAGENISALAVIIDNPVTRIVGNFFIKFNQPAYPLRFFPNVEEAMMWIRKNG